MDGISFASSVAGLVLAAGKVIGFLSSMVNAPSTARGVLAEAQALQAIFRQLVGFTSAPNQQSGARLSRIQLHDLILILTGCVRTFSELDEELKGLGGADYQGADSVALTKWERAKWAAKDGGIAKILRHLQMHKVSLGLMLSIYSWSVQHLTFSPFLHLPELRYPVQIANEYVQRLSTASAT